MKRLLLAVPATVALLVALAMPASAHVTVNPPTLLAAAASGGEHGSSAGSPDTASESSDGDDGEDGTDELTFLALLVGGVAVTLALAALVRAGRRIPQ